MRNARLCEMDGMTDSCYCDYGERADFYKATRHTARKQHRCYECDHPILPGERYEAVSSLYDGYFERSRTCPRCLDVREYVTAHAPCFCWLRGSMLDDAKDTLERYGRESAGFWIGGMKRLLRAQRQPRVFTGLRSPSAGA